MSQLRCYTCLQLHRKLSPLKAQVKFILTLLCPEMFMKTKENAQYLICWECQSMAAKIKRFQSILKKANETLQLSFKGKTTTIKGLSSLKVTAVETISITQPENVPILPQNVPILPQNVPILQQNVPILPQYVPMLPQNVPILPQNEVKLPENLPMLPQNEQMLPLNVPMLPKIVPRVPQNILELSLRDMLAIPIKVDTEVDFKVEEENCSKDFDELIQSTTILQVPRNESDPLLILRPNQPAEIEVPPQKPVIDEIIDPAINSTPQKVLTHAPKDEVQPQGFRKAVKCTLDDPYLGTENPDFVKKVPVKNKRSDALLTKLLSTPSKREELIFKRPCVPNSNPSKEPKRSEVDRQGVPNSNHPNESECSEQNSGVASTENEAKLVILNRTELNAIREKKRLNSAYMLASHRCERCIKWFNSQEKLGEHNLKHDDKSRGNSICEICEQRFANDSLRSEHYQQHFIVYECHKCPNRYSNRVQLSVHCRRKHEESTFLCKKCFVTFKTFKERSTHILETHNERKNCEECGKTFSTVHMLKAHVLNVHKSKPVACPLCKKLVKKQSLTVHMRTHGEKSEDGAYCADCGTTYKSKYIYENHLKYSLKHNTIQKLGLKCDHCEVYFSNRASLKSHTEEIGGIKYTCDICHKVSKTKRILKRHIQSVHEGKKPKKKLSVCDICGKSFTVKKCLKEHLNVHLGIRPHVCKDCGATFTYSAALFTHRRLKHKVSRKYEMTSKMAIECAVKE